VNTGCPVQLRKVTANTAGYPSPTFVLVGNAGCLTGASCPFNLPEDATVESQCSGGYIVRPSTLSGTGNADGEHTYYDFKISAIRNKNTEIGQTTNANGVGDTSL
jgi:hypothetical protein